MKSKFTALFSFLFAIATFNISAHAEPEFHRFWIGYKKSDISNEVFQNKIVELFVPATLRISQKNSLRSYQPVILKPEAEMPDEIALVTYRSEAEYRAYRATPEGKAYGDLHWEYFDQSRSKSFVPTTGAIESLTLNSALNLNPGFDQWSDSKTYFKFTPRISLDQAKAMIRDRMKLTPLGYIVWVGDKGFAEYFAGEKAPSGFIALKKDVSALTQLPGGFNPSIPKE